MRFLIPLFAACLLLGAAICEAQSNTVPYIEGLRYPTGSVVILPPITAPAITPPPRQPASDALIAAAFMNMRQERMERGLIAWLGVQAFEVLEEKEVSWMEPERDVRGLPTGIDVPTTNWVVLLKPKGTNAPMVRGASKDGSVTLIFSKPVPAGITIDVNIRQTP